MKVVLFQTLLMGTYILFLIAARQWARDRSLRQAEEARERRAALEREWKVGIPYDPDPDENGRTWRR